MHKPSGGTTQPALSTVGDQEALKPNLRTYRTPDGGSFQITEEEFTEIVLIFEFLRKSREERDNEPKGLEPETSTQPVTSPVNLRKVG